MRFGRANNFFLSISRVAPFTVFTVFFWLFLPFTVFFAQKDDWETSSYRIFYEMYERCVNPKLDQKIFTNATGNWWIIKN